MSYKPGALVSGGALGTPASADLRNALSVPPHDVTRFRFQFEDFDHNALGTSAGLGFTGNSSGGSQGIDYTYSTAGHPGTWSFTAGVGSGDRGGLTAGNSAASKFGGGTFTLEYCTLIPTLSTGTNEYKYQLGMVGNDDGTYAGTTDGLWFLYDRAVYGVNWQLVSRSASTDTVRDTGIAVVNSTTVFQKLTAVVNAAGTSIQAYVNGAAAGAAITTNISAVGMFHFLQSRRSAGTPPVVYLDYASLLVAFTTPR